MILLTYYIFSGVCAIISWELGKCMYRKLFYKTIRYKDIAITFSRFKKFPKNNLYMTEADATKALKKLYQKRFQ